jgi:hypothetical protein
VTAILLHRARFLHILANSLYTQPLFLSLFFTLTPLGNLHHFLIYALFFGFDALWQMFLHLSPLFLMGILLFDLRLSFYLRSLFPGTQVGRKRKAGCVGFSHEIFRQYCIE